MYKYLTSFFREGRTVQNHVALADNDDIGRKAAELILSFNGYKVDSFKSGEDLLSFLRNNSPDLVMLDVKTAGIDGFETLKRMQGDENASRIPVIFLASGHDTNIESKALSSGALDFVSKPYVTSILLLRVKNMIQLGKLKNELKTEVERRSGEAVKEHERNEKLSLQVVQTLAGTIDAKDKYTNGHSSRVAEYAREIAKRAGYSLRAQEEIYMMGLLHDVGKIGIPDTVINKPSKLTDEEYSVIKTHPMVGYGILKNITEMPQLAIGARYHHERYDGMGYPDGLKGTDIPEEARIIAVADAYDAMSSRRSYHGVFAQEYIKSELEKGKSKQFDPNFAEIMLGIIKEDEDYSLREHYETSADANDDNDKNEFSGKDDETVFAYISMLEAGGLNTAIGLRYCMNDVDFYAEMLREFTASAEDREKQLNTSLENGDISKYRVYVHSLKNASRTVGAERLSMLAEDMEEAARKKDMTFINENHEDLIANMKMTVGGILMAVNMYGNT